MLHRFNSMVSVIAVFSQSDFIPIMLINVNLRRHGLNKLMIQCIKQVALSDNFQYSEIIQISDTFCLIVEEKHTRNLSIILQRYRVTDQLWRATLINLNNIGGKKCLMDFHMDPDLYLHQMWRKNSILAGTCELLSDTKVLGQRVSRKQKLADSPNFVEQRWG